MKSLFFLSVALCTLFANTCATAQSIITTIAGNGQQNSGGEGVAATAAQLNSRLVVRGDAAGNLYIADLWNYKIRKIDAATSIIHTIAGTGALGFSGDGGLAVNAMISPAAMSLDAAGNIYFIDHDRIRKIAASTGIINTIAGDSLAGYTGDGGLAIAAKFDGLGGIWVDGGNNIYVCDANNNVVRKIDGATGIITTVVGNGYLAGGIYGSFTGDGGAATAAGLNHPLGICLDAAGNIYFVDWNNDRVRKVDAATGIITTVAGHGAASLSSGDGGPATAAYLESAVDVWPIAGGGFYIVQDDYSIRKVSAFGIISTIAGNAGQGYNGDELPAVSSKLYYPASVYRDAGGNVFIGDGGNNRIRKIDAAGTIHTICGTGDIQFYGDGGPCVDAELDGPQNICSDGAGNIYFSDNLNNRIRKINAAGIITTVAGNGPAFSTSGTFAGDGGAAINAGLSSPQGVCVDAAGNIYIADAKNYRVRMVNAATGIITTIAGNGAATPYVSGGLATATAIDMPTALCMDGAGNLYIGTYSLVMKVDPVTNIISTVGGTGTFGYSGDNGHVSAADLGAISGMCTDNYGNIYISDSRYNVVRKISIGSGIITTVAGSGYVVSEYELGMYSYYGGYDGDGGAAINAKLNHPCGLHIDWAGTLLIADNYNNALRAVTADGIIHTIAGDGLGAGLNPNFYLLNSGFSGDGGNPVNAKMSRPADVCLDRNGDILTTDAGNSRIRKITNPTAVVNVNANNGIVIAPNPSAGIFSIIATGNSKIQGVDIYNVAGQKVYHSIDNTGASTNIDISNQPTGIYVAAIQSNSGVIMQKVVLQH